MPFVATRWFDLQALRDLLASGEDWVLGLYAGDLEPHPADGKATYEAREASFPGYGRKTLSRRVGEGAWSEPRLEAPSGWTRADLVAHSRYGAEPLRWEVGGRAVISGYFVVGATTGELVLAERFEDERKVHAGDSLSITPVFELGGWAVDRGEGDGIQERGRRAR